MYLFWVTLYLHRQVWLQSDLMLHGLLARPICTTVWNIRISLPWPLFFSAQLYLFKALYLTLIQESFLGILLFTKLSVIKYVHACLWVCNWNSPGAMPKEESQHKFEQQVYLWLIAVIILIAHLLGGRLQEAVWSNQAEIGSSIYNNSENSYTPKKLNCIFLLLKIYSFFHPFHCT